MNVKNGHDSNQSTEVDLDMKKSNSNNTLRTRPRRGAFRVGISHELEYT